MSRIKNVFIAFLTLGILLLIPSCARCVLQGPFCNRNMMNQSMIDLDINNNTRYLTDTQRKAACVTMASNFMPFTHLAIVTNNVFNGTAFVQVVTTNVVTNYAYLPPSSLHVTGTNGRVDMSVFDNPIANDLYGVNCNLSWQ